MGPLELGGAGRVWISAVATNVRDMGHRKHPRMKCDEVLTDLFAGLVIAALLVGVIAQMHA